MPVRNVCACIAFAIKVEILQSQGLHPRNMGDLVKNNRFSGARSYLKCQVILDFEQQCRLVKRHRKHAGPSALSFSRQGASIWIIKSKIPYFSYGREKTADSQIPFFFFFVFIWFIWVSVQEIQCPYDVRRRYYDQ